MATAGGKKRLPSKVSVPRNNFSVPPLPLDVVPVRRKTGEDVMGWIAACVLVALLLPMGAMLYLDNLTTTARTEKALEKIEKLERQIERKERDKNRKDPDAFDDNPVFDRVRRPLSVSLPRSEKLGKP